MSEKKKSLQYLSGMHAAIPVILGFVPVGIAYAIMARQAGFSVLQTCGMSLAVFAGASQMMAVGMYIQGRKHNRHDTCNLYFEFAPFDYERMRCKPNAEGHNKNQAVGSFWGNG
ncbi:MAG: AzlC family ABC transporter permease [Enterocloster clostridioformis]